MHLFRDSYDEFLYYITIFEITGKKCYALDIRSVGVLVQDLNDGKQLELRKFKGIIPLLIQQGMPTDQLVVFDSFTVILDTNLKIKIGSRTEMPKNRVELIFKNLKDISLQAESVKKDLGS